MVPGGNTISIVDLASRRRTGDIDLGKYRRPHGIEFGESGRLYVTTDFPAAVVVVDPAERKIVKAVELEDTLPHMLAVTRDEKRAYVACSGSGTEAIVDLEAGTAKAVEIGGVPMGIRLSPDEKRVWATNRTGEAIVAIDTAVGSIFNRHPMMGQPVRLALSPDKRRVLVSFIGSGDAAVLDAITMQPERRFPVGKRAEGLAYDAEGKFVYVTAQGEDKMLKVSTTSWKPVLEIKTGAKPDTPIVFDLR
jgi:DNA-binding beta-propeller fold protein YncE